MVETMNFLGMAQNSDRFLRPKVLASSAGWIVPGFLFVSKRDAQNTRFIIHKTYLMTLNNPFCMPSLQAAECTSLQATHLALPFTEC